MRTGECVPSAVQGRWCWRKELQSRSHLYWAWLFLGLAMIALYLALAQPIELLAYDAALDHVPRSLVFSQAISDGALYPR
jgi:hypothetical protein